jgi:hypothetical protein
MPQSLHTELAEAAEREQVSLNQFITLALAAAVGWRQPSRNGAGEANAEPPRAARSVRRLASRAALDACADRRLVLDGLRR